MFVGPTLFMSSDSVFYSAEDDCDSSDSGSISKSSDFVPVDIPSRREETAPIPPYTTYRFYGLDVEFPRDRTPFTSQKSTMTAVSYLVVCNWIRS